MQVALVLFTNLMDKYGGGHDFFSAGSAMKFRVNIILLFAFWLFSALCTREKWPVNPDNFRPTQSKFGIATDKDEYSWIRTENGKMAIIQGTLKNHTPQIYYYDVENPSDSATVYHDYSNIFELD